MPSRWWKDRFAGRREVFDWTDLPGGKALGAIRRLIHTKAEKTIEHTEELGGELYCCRQGLSKGRWIPTPAAFVLVRCLDIPVRIVERW